jgi:AraC family transcriptional regulator, transcriptional activator of pobA
MKTGHVASIRQLTYQPPAGAVAQVETMTFERLRQLDRGDTQRGDFHVLGLVERGEGAVAIDFSAQPLASGDTVWIGPGVVHRWINIAHLDGDLVLFTPTAPVTAPARQLASAQGIAASWPGRERRPALIAAALHHLRLESATAIDALEPASDVLGCLLSVLLARIDPPAYVVSSGNETFRRFRDAVEADLAHRHDAGHYARMLGCSGRTLARAAQQATGRSAKDYLNERLVLEAKRLLVHDRLAAAQCSTRLGFPDPSGFSAFFRRETGMRPGAWRDEQIQRAPTTN